MQGIEVLYWALSIVFCLALFFAILVWCRGWRKEEQEGNTRQIQLLAREVKRLSDAIEALDHTAASLQTADEQLSRQIDTLRNTARALKTSAALPMPTTEPIVATSATIKHNPEPQPQIDDNDDRYIQARTLLLAGRDPVEVARQLDLGTAEVRMIARLLDTTDTNT